MGQGGDLDPGGLSGEGIGAPLGEAIVKKAREENLNLLDPKDFQAIPGLGIQATIDSKKDPSW